MNFSFTLKRSQMKVFSAIFSNLAVVWLIALFGTRDPLTLTLNLVAAIVSIDLAVKAEELLEEI